MIIYVFAGVLSCGILIYAALELACDKEKGKSDFQTNKPNSLTSVTPNQLVGESAHSQAPSALAQNFRWMSHSVRLSNCIAATNTKQTSKLMAPHEGVSKHTLYRASPHQLCKPAQSDPWDCLDSRSHGTKKEKLGVLQKRQERTTCGCSS